MSKPRKTFGNGKRRSYKVYFKYSVKKFLFPFSQVEQTVWRSSPKFVLKQRMELELLLFRRVAMSLPVSFPRGQDGLELSIARQPEQYFRARYQKEGTRGCIKDRTGMSCPALQVDFFGPIEHTGFKLRSLFFFGKALLKWRFLRTSNYICVVQG